MNKLACTLVFACAFFACAFFASEKKAELDALARIDVSWTVSAPASNKRPVARRAPAKPADPLFAEMVEFFGARRARGGFHLSREHTSCGPVVVITCTAANGASKALAEEFVRALRNDGFTAKQDGFAVRVERG